MNQNIQNKPISMDMLNPPSEDQKEDAFRDIYKFSETALNKNLNQKTMINLNNNPNTITSNQNFQSSILNTQQQTIKTPSPNLQNIQNNQNIQNYFNFQNSESQVKQNINIPVNQNEQPQSSQSMNINQLGATSNPFDFM